MSNKIQMTEEQAREFIKPIFIHHSFYEPNMQSAINELKEAGHIIKSELQQKVEEAEESWEHYRINCLSPNFESDDRDEIIIELHQAFIALKQSHPEFKEERDE